MKFQATLITLIAAVTATPHTLESRAWGALGGPPSTGEVCPQAQQLWHLTKNNYFYQIGCAVETGGDTAIAVYAGVSNVLDCAQHCDTWNAIAATNPKCSSATYYKVPNDGVNNCVLRPGQRQSEWYAWAPVPNAETAFLGPKSPY